ARRPVKTAMARSAVPNSKFHAALALSQATSCQSLGPAQAAAPGTSSSQAGWLALKAWREREAASTYPNWFAAWRPWLGSASAGKHQTSNKRAAASLSIAGIALAEGLGSGEVIASQIAVPPSLSKPGRRLARGPFLGASPDQGGEAVGLGLLDSFNQG